MISRKILPNLVACVIALTGCSESAPKVTVAEKNDETPSAPKVVVPPTASQSGEVSLAALLTESRENLAKMCVTEREKIEYVLKKRDIGQLRFLLAPKAALPLVIPVFQEAAFDPALGISIPPYYQPGGSDPALAKHLESFGDKVAAETVANGKKVAASASSNTIPLEWTRYVYLRLHYTCLEVARGDETAVRKIVHIHEQLQKLAEAKKFPAALSAALLNKGRYFLERVHERWEQDKKTALSAQTTKDLARWGKPVPPVLPLQPGLSEKELTDMAGVQFHGRMGKSKNFLRVLDMGNLPMPNKFLTEVYFFLDANNKLQDYSLVYSSGATKDHLTIHSWLHWLGVDDETNKTTKYDWPGGQLDITCFALFGRVGAVVRFYPPRQAIENNVGMAFGPVHLLRSFEQHRRMLAKDQAGDVLKLTPNDKSDKSQGDPFAQAELHVHKSKNGDQVSAVTGVIPPETKESEALDVLEAFWAAYGRQQSVAEVNVNAKTYLRFTWADDNVQLQVDLPEKATVPVPFRFQFRKATDVSSKQLNAFDKQERELRKKNGNALTFLPTTIGALTLGMPRSEVESLLKSVSKDDQSNGNVQMYVLGGPATADEVQPRTVFCRFGTNNQLDAMMIVFSDGKAAGNGLSDLVNSYRTKYGVPLTFQKDMGLDGAAKTSVWQDDERMLTATEWSGALQVTLCSLDEPFDDLRFLPRGPVPECQLGMTKSELLKNAPQAKWQEKQQEYVIALSNNDRYDVVKAKIENDQVVEVSAVAKPDATNQPVQTRLIGLWGQQMSQLAWPKMQKVTSGGITRLATCDSSTIIAMFLAGEGNRQQAFVQWRLRSKQ